MTTTVFARKIWWLGPVAMGLILGLASGVLFELAGEGLKTYLMALPVLGAAWWAASLTLKHFHGHHHHHGDSFVDYAPVAALLFANIFHPAVDGFALAGAFAEGGAVVGLFFLAAVALHEVIRQSALIVAFKHFRIRGLWVVATALLGIGAGVMAGFFGKQLAPGHHVVVDLGTLFAYSFILFEGALADHGYFKLSRLPLVAIGAGLGVLVGLIG